MVRLTFLDADTLGPEPGILDPLKKIGALTTYPATAPEQRVERLAGTDVGIVNKVLIDEEILGQLTNLKLIAIAATGSDNIDLDAAGKAGVAVCNVRGYSTESVAQHTIGAMIALATGIHHYAGQESAWSESPIFTRYAWPVIELSGKTLGIVGAGAIGQKVGRIAEAMGMKVCCYAREPGQEPCGKWPRLSPDEFFSGCDVISLHCPLTPATHNLISADTLGMMKPGAFLINTGRGPLVDETALLQALREKTLGGAALDVLGVEPPPAEHPLLNTGLPNLIITPHTAWSALDSRKRLMEKLSNNIQSFFRGESANRLV